ncbi:MAG: hypothetical protein HY905_11105 [Deltaproteobacteria bacterium]|nr:hypothetical protein [Deltaproteobacteria bacterium]
MSTGIRPAVAQTLVEFGVDLSAVATPSNPRDGLHEWIRASAPERGFASAGTRP